MTRISLFLSRQLFQILATDTAPAPTDSNSLSLGSHNGSSGKRALQYSIREHPWYSFGGAKEDHMARRSDALADRLEDRAKRAQQKADAWVEKGHAINADTWQQIADLNSDWARAERGKKK
jgi:hypothetical protein